MNNSPLISICIPAYKRIHYLKKLLESISKQTFKEYEVVITDDTPDGSVENFVKEFRGIERIYYYNNEPTLGTPENWNEAIRKAKGVWIKLMHDDDWFSTNDALQVFYENIQKHRDADFFFSAFENVEEGSGKTQIVKMSFLDKFIFGMNPYHLLKKVYVGNPSCTLVRRDLDIWYDSRYQFIVDFEYYIRIIQRTEKPVYIDKVLLNIGFHDEQVTAYTKYNPAVQIPENITFLNEQKKDILKNILVFDYYWRLMRNLKIDSVEKLLSFLKAGTQPKRGIEFIIQFQKRIPYSLLKIGLLSKFFMMIAYGINFVKN
jgi:glycosyltransferase involved in cell wall biosynthesis